jgi:hypothetical protein
MTRTVILISAYIAAQMISDIGSLKIIPLLGFSMDAGTFIYPITFTLRDLVHKTMGKSASQTMIFSAAVINLLMAVFFWFVSALPGDPMVGSQNSFGAVLAPVWRIVIASILAEVVSELLDTEIYHLWKKRMGPRHQWSRVLVSNSVSIPVDSLLFAVLAFWGTYQGYVIAGIILTNMLIKWITTIVSIPLIYAVTDQESS